MQMTEQDPTVGEVTDFYDDFLERRMVDYRLRPNKRLEMASKALREIVRDGDTVADIGCGIGIIAENLGKAFPKSQITAVDLSGANIEYAKKTVGAPNVRFFASDITEQMGRLRDACPDGYDVVFLIDVIEHVPEKDRAGLLQDLADIASDGATLFLAYPSPEYQDYLRAEEPEELQVIDNNVEAQQLVSEALEAGWMLKSYAYKDIWREGQYIHAAFVKGSKYGALDPVPTTLSETLRSKLIPMLLRPFRYRKYVDNPLGTRRK